MRCILIHPHLIYRKSPAHRRNSFKMAEMERFELSKPFWGLHDFQSCALDQLRDISVLSEKMTYQIISLAIIIHKPPKVKDKFHAAISGSETPDGFLELLTFMAYNRLQR